MSNLRRRVEDLEETRFARWHALAQRVMADDSWDQLTDDEVDFLAAGDGTDPRDWNRLSDEHLERIVAATPDQVEAVVDRCFRELSQEENHHAIEV